MNPASPRPANGAIVPTPACVDNADRVVTVFKGVAYGPTRFSVEAVIKAVDGVTRVVKRIDGGEKKGRKGKR